MTGAAISVMRGVAISAARTTVLRNRARVGTAGSIINTSSTARRTSNSAARTTALRNRARAGMAGRTISISNNNARRTSSVIKVRAAVIAAAGSVSTTS
ncbi:hypothetical protein D9M68_869370 [compost metagenome]